MKAVVFSDTHHSDITLTLPKADFGIFCGDCCTSGSRHELDSFLKMFSEQPFTYKLFTPGNHDRFTESNPEETQKMMEFYGIIYLHETVVEIDGYRFFGTGIQPHFCNWSWNVRSATKRKEHYNLILDGLDVLITHCPPKGILDKTKRNEHVGCPVLRNRIEKVLPRFHVFGHIHEDYGCQVVNGIMCINASMCDERYNLHNSPVVIDLNDNRKIITNGERHD